MRLLIRIILIVALLVNISAATLYLMDWLAWFVVTHQETLEQEKEEWPEEDENAPREC